MMLETAVDNHLAQALYEKNGWERVKDELFYRVYL
jgi:ribosomal protein S18 acetylase RimI-like enzyme